jgi:hypothetical protein
MALFYLAAIVFDLACICALSKSMPLIDKNNSTLTRIETVIISNKILINVLLFDLLGSRLSAKVAAKSLYFSGVISFAGFLWLYIYSVGWHPVILLARPAFLLGGSPFLARKYSEKRKMR